MPESSWSGIDRLFWKLPVYGPDIWIFCRRQKVIPRQILSVQKACPMSGHSVPAVKKDWRRR
ncbi:MAG TPA: hypothetical protein DCS74_01005 [Veillonellaceae bacterium]|nr:hypothetical protein [Veillonellaceae bacterium]